MTKTADTLLLLAVCAACESRPLDTTPPPRSGDAANPPASALLGPNPAAPLPGRLIGTCLKDAWCQIVTDRHPGPPERACQTAFRHGLGCPAGPRLGRCLGGLPAGTHLVFPKRGLAGEETAARKACAERQGVFTVP